MVREHVRRQREEEAAYQAALYEQVRAERERRESVTSHGRRICDYCGSQIPIDDPRCQFCMAPQPMCANCEESMLRQDVYGSAYWCPKCGGSNYPGNIRPMTPEERERVRRIG